jgi:hypothetical protein
MTVKGKTLATFFFKAFEEENNCCTCNKCNGKYKSPSGFSNLLKHVESCIGKDWKDQMVLHLEKNGSKVLEDGTISSFYVSNESDLRAYTWIKWIVCRNMPMSEVG